MTNYLSSQFRNGLMVTAAIVCVAQADCAHAQTRAFDVPAQDAAQGVAALARQADAQILISARDAKGKRTNAVRGTMSIESAIAALIASTGFEARRSGDHTWAIICKGAPGEFQGNSAASLGVTASAGEAITGSAAKNEIAEIVVTGTNIRGNIASSSPLTTYSRIDIERSGATSIEQFTQNLPQNFKSIDQETFGNGAIPNSGDNFGAGAGIDLRGLGAGSTLVLINGRRSAPSGASGSFIDISSIPIAAVERMDVVTDGASAIYGADAVAGVVNFVLRDHYDGAETSLYASLPTRGGGEQFGASQIVGKSWNSGSLVLSADYLRSRPILASARSFIPDETYPLPFTLTPREERASLFGYLRQNVGNVGQLYAQGSFRNKDFSQDNSLGTFLALATSGRAKAANLIVGGLLNISSGWSADVSGLYALSDERTSTNYIPEIAPLSKNMKRSNVRSLNGILNGELIRLGGGPARIALGFELRHEALHALNTTTGPAAVDLHRKVGSVFGELNVPIVGFENSRSGIARFELNLAARYDHYERIGSTANPKFGLLWSPVDRLTLRSTFGTSFRPPLLSDLSVAGTSYVAYPFPGPPAGPDVVNVLYSGGSNSDLKPEKSMAYTFGADIAPKDGLGFAGSLTYFHIKYRNRIAVPPVVGSAFDIFSQLDTIGSFVEYPANPASVQNIFDTNAVVNPFALAPSEIGAYFDSRLQNIATVITSGLEFSASYNWDFSNNRLGINVSGNYIIALKQASQPGNPFVHLESTTYQPANLRINGGLSWSRGAFSSVATLRYTGGYQNNLVSPTGKVASWTIVDATIGYDLSSDNSSGLFSGLRAALAVQNLFDKPPPTLRVDPNGFISDIRYDPANASARGRTLTVRLTKRW